MLGAIDVGMSGLKGARLDITGQPKLVISPWGDSVTPTVIFLGPNGAVFGMEAVQAGAMDPSRCIQHAKRKTGTGEVLGVGHDGKEWRSGDCYQFAVAWFKRMVETATGEIVDQVVLTVPANYMDPQIREVRQAAEAAGLEVILIVREPTAFAVCNNGTGRGNGKVMVIDVGGGTTDVTILSSSGNNLDVMGTSGIAELGGRDFTAKLETGVLDPFCKQHGFVPDKTADAVELMNLTSNCERAKILLSRCPSAPVVFTCRGHTIRLDFTQADFERLCADLGTQLINCVTQALDDCKLKPADLREVLLAGGACQTPMLAACIEKALGIKPVIAREPMHGAALGAVIMGQAELARRGKTVSVGGVLIPPPEFFIQEVTAHPLGVTVVIPGSNKLVHSVVVPRGHPFPCDITRNFQLALPNATVARIEILQGDPDAAREACVILGSVEMDGLPPIPDRPHVLEIRFRLDADGVAWVTARDVESGKVVEMKVDTRKVPPTP